MASEVRPNPPHSTTSSTVVPRTSQPVPPLATSSGKKPADDDAHDRSSIAKDPESPSEEREPPTHTIPTRFAYHLSYFTPLVLTIIMLWWPWIFFGVVWTRDGIIGGPRFSRLVRENPQTVTFFATHLGTLFAGITAFLFSTAIIRFSQKWITARDEVDVAHLTLFTTLRHQTFPWTVQDRAFLLRKWHLVIIVLTCIVAFNFVPSSISSLLGPAPFNKTIILTGSELNFASSAPDCVQWLRIPRISGTCNWFTYGDLRYTSCLAENQLSDALESGRGSIFALLPNNTHNQVYSQLGNREGLQFLGPIRGVMPLGPNGVPAFDTLSASPLSDPHLTSEIRAYQYSLGLQGLVSGVKCEYTTSSPIIFNRTIAGADQVLGSCPAGQDVLPARTLFLSILSNHTMGSWTCGQGNRSQDGTFGTYLLYLRGARLYDAIIGNVTCTVSPVQHAIFPVTFSSQSGAFTASQPSQLSTTSPSDLIIRSIMAISSLVTESQGFAANAVAESVITYGVKSFGLPPDSQQTQYLRLFEAMLQGMIEYQATYVRLIYTANSADAPSSCRRTVNGSGIYEVIGWHCDTKTIAFLLPTTLINLASLILLLVAMYMGMPIIYSTDPTDAKSLLLATTELRRGNTKVKIDLSTGEQHSFWKGLWETIKETLTSCTQDAGMAGVEQGAQTATEKVDEVATEFKNSNKSPV